MKMWELARARHAATQPDGEYMAYRENNGAGEAGGLLNTDDIAGVSTGSRSTDGEPVSDFLNFVHAVHPPNPKTQPEYARLFERAFRSVFGIPSGILQHDNHDG
jgi:hypothetical protein